MIQSEAVEMPGVSSYHQVQGDVEPENFELLPSLLGGKVNNSSTSEMFKV